MKRRSIDTIDLTANQITAELLIQIPRRFPQIRLWRQNTGLAFGADSVDMARRSLQRGDVAQAIEYLQRRPIRFGIAGQADISGIVAPTGRRLEIEVKSGNDKLSLEQIAFRKMVWDRGGIYIEARDVAVCLEEIEVALR